jgi:hypothetical protein
MMKRSIAAGAALAAALFGPAADATLERASEDGGVLAVTAIDAVAKVIKTDPARGTMTIKDLEGKTVTLRIPPEMPRDQVKKGSLLDVHYVEAEALTIAKPGAPADEEVRNVTMAPQSGTLGEFTAQPKRVAGRIAGIDRGARELTIMGPDNERIALNVAPEVAGFDELKAGDAAVIEYTEAAALSAVRHDAGR